MLRLRIASNPHVTSLDTIVARQTPLFSNRAPVELVASRGDEIHSYTWRLRNPPTSSCDCGFVKPSSAALFSYCPCPPEVFRQIALVRDPRLTGDRPRLNLCRDHGLIELRRSCSFWSSSPPMIAPTPI
ncbi:hypothetical protein KIN20_028187 [Parelaphostrongylus tenuis]|uniref:Uncharacterized protein n=1 Tax=Parelaphostrongylus tenuis TaxID=148309 RepID=A0AAD5R0D1_PARTN|nr:hypothetical protein KIN20_028187 [Parelaphostrongylus tenuis]